VVAPNTDYVSRKWARWPVPTPASMGLPHPMSYVDNGDGTITDKVTGLLWQKTIGDPAPTATMAWADAIAYCDNLSLAGTGWSLPTRIELTTILDNAQPSGARVNATFFKFAAKAGWTWASTPWVVDSRKTVDPPLSWFINFSAGDSNNSLDQTAASAYARCVRVPVSETLPAMHYTIANGEVKDNYTGLSWQQDDSGATPSLAYSDAVTHCSSLALNGQTWRLPTLNELASTVDDVPTGNVSPAVDHTAFPNTSANQWYWSSVPSGSSTTESWMLNFEDGYTAHKPNTTLGIARCVR
jgi:hypothetical protein